MSTRTQRARDFSRPGKNPDGFTLIEMLVACALLIVVVGLVLKLTNQTSVVWRDSNSRIQAFQEARAGYEAMTRKLSQATLNTYYDYYNSSNEARVQVPAASLAAFEPVTYDRISDLHFICGQSATLLQGSTPAITTQTHAVFFQAPLGYSVAYTKLGNALNACGYFLQFDDAQASVPDYVKNSPGYKPRFRWRLKEMMQSTEELAIYAGPATGSGLNDWFVKNAAGNSRVLAENVIALVLLPKLSSRDDDPSRTGKGVSIAPNFNYNSRISLGAISDAFWSTASPAFPPDKFNAYPSKGGTTAASRHHQLPPLLRVVMVVLDEPSAMRLQGTATSVPAALDLASANLFRDASLLDDDIKAVEDICNAKSGNLTGNRQKLGYRVFSSDLIMREAKWSNK